MGLHEGYYGVAGGQILHPDTLEIFLHVRFTEQLVQLGRERDVRHEKKTSEEPQSPTVQRVKLVISSIC